MFDDLQKILVHNLMIPAEDVSPEATPQDIDLDSLAIVELSMVLEKEWHIAIKEDEIAAAATLGDIAQLMEQRSATV